MVRKVTFLSLATMALSSLIIVCELVVLTLGRAPARFAGASPQASGRQAHQVGAPSAIVGSPLRPPSREGPAEGGLGWTSAPAVPDRRIGLRTASVPGQPLERSEYSSSTGLAEAGSILDGARAVEGAKAPPFLLGTIMLLAMLIVARDGGRAQLDAWAAVGMRVPRMGARAPGRPSGSTGMGARAALLRLSLRQQGLVRTPLGRVQYAPVAPARHGFPARDPAADWMRRLLVPT
ncbi:MAG: hypothetical protein QME94_17630 [Anaerolineae bacterium]|nr:hypothetical protein [Anaerolineae bacterium]